MTERLKPHFFLTSLRERDSLVQKIVRHFDWILFLDVLALCIIGVVMIYSASLRLKSHELIVSKQSVALLVGIAFLFLLAILNYQVFEIYPRPILMFSILLLLSVLFLGSAYRGTRAWFALGPFSFQPSEVSKLLVILVVAGWCSQKEEEMEYLKSVFVPFCIVLAHILLILLQPDFGSTLVYFPVLIAILYVAGTPSIYLLTILFYAVVSLGFLLLHTGFSLRPPLLETGSIYSFFYKGMKFGKEFFWIHVSAGSLILFLWWFLKGLRYRVSWVSFLFVFLILSVSWTSSSYLTQAMKGYQRKRLMVFIQPELDPMGAGYHVIQSVVALGSGQMTGKGLFSGTQGRLGFLPEQHTDFIFSVLGEELGYVGSSMVLIFYMVLIWRAFAIAAGSRDRFGMLTAVGIGTMFAFYAILNLAMVMGFAPVAGLPLPFLSCGGSSLVISLAAVGILLSIHSRRFTY
ncbi:MAG: rod shape-determining protein RodA [Elusimicrobia bacterium]|nr:rod shape-determining protein RodA [Elusimicrobiota bacterium]